MQAVLNGFGKGRSREVKRCYKYAPSEKIEPAPGRSGPFVELLATVNCLLRGDGALLVRDRWHLARFNSLPESVISHPETLKGLPVAEIGHHVMFRGLPVCVN